METKNTFQKKFNFVFFLLIFLFIWLQYSSSENLRSLKIPYSEFQKLLDENKVNDLVITDKTIQGKFTTPRPDKMNAFSTERVETDLVKDLTNKNITYKGTHPSNFLENILSWVLPIFIFYAVFYYFAQRNGKEGMGGGFLSIGKSRAKLYVETDVKITFADVAGVEEAKAELQEVVDFLKNPKSYGRLGARLPKGILLIGPPGTGKTLLAKSVAGEAKVPFFSISGSEFVEMFVGVGAARVRDLFLQARQKAPCIVFIDELDSLGRARTGFVSGGYDEKEQTLNQLLAELDGFDTMSEVVILAATNRPEILDPALLRSGRFDRQVLLDRPDKVAREAILKVHIKKIKIDPQLNIEHIAALTPGFTGADMANLVNEAALAATRKHSESVTEEHFTEAIERIIAGLEKKTRVVSLKEKKIIAFHEMGHTLVSAAIPTSDKVHKVSIISRGIGSLGYTIQRPSEDRYLMTRQELLDKMAILLGGRMAEVIVFNETSTGASDDLVKVTNIAEDIITKYGMSKNLGPVVFDLQKNTILPTVFPGNDQRPRSEETSKIIDSEIKMIIDEAAMRAKNILELNRQLLEDGANLLLEKETLGEGDIKKLIEKIKYH